HQAIPAVHSALDDRTLDVEDALEDLVVGEEPRQVLAADVLREVLELGLHGVGAGVEDLFDLVADHALLLGPEWLGVCFAAYRARHSPAVSAIRACSGQSELCGAAV